MKSDIVSKLKNILADPPAELVAHFSNDSLPNEPDLFINLLNLDDSLRFSSAIQDKNFGAPLGLIVLDEANNSNPFCYVSRGPARGLVIYYSHDEGPAFAFSSLASFIDAIQQAIESEETIEDLVFDKEFPSVNQSDLVAYLKNECENDGNEAIICLLTTLLRNPPIEIVNLLAKNEDFYVRESLAEHIANHPQPSLLQTATTLAGDSHPQVARPGKRALDAVRRSE